MRIKVSFIILVLILVYSCIYRHVDKMTLFHIYGRVYEKESEVPLKDINIVFINQGFDDRRQYRKEPLIIGHSNENGEIEIDFDFWWGRSEGFLLGDAKKEFAIELSGSHHNFRQVKFKEADLQRIERRIQVPLGTIYLESMK